MGVKRQQGGGDQKDLFDEALQASLRHGATGDGGTRSGACAAPQAFTAWERQRALTQHLMEQVASSSNLNQADKRVKAYKGAAGVDGMTVAELLAWIEGNGEATAFAAMPTIATSTCGLRRRKSAVAQVEERSFLGHRLLRGGGLGLAPKSLVRAKERLCRLTRRNRGIALERMIGEVNSFTTGWVTYCRHAACKTALLALDEWLRRKLRCVRLKHCKRAKPTVDFLVKCGVPARRAWPLALSGKGWWPRSGSPPAAEAMTLPWFAGLGLVSLAAHYAARQPAGNRRVR